MELLGTSFFWVTLGQIMMINIMLSGDNAVVIAMASRALPPKQQRQAILFGSFGAIFLRVILTFFAVMLLTLPGLKLVGAVLLMYIGVKMLIPEEAETHLDGHIKLWAAIKTIIVADFIMSLDNVLGVAAAAKGNVVLLVLGLAISIPLIIYGSTLVLKLMNRYPVIITIGGGILGWVAGEMGVTDPLVLPWVDANAHWMHTGMPVFGALLVVVVGKALTANEGRQGGQAAGKGGGDRGRARAAGVPLDAPRLAHLAGRHPGLRRLLRQDRLSLPAPDQLEDQDAAPEGARGVRL
jgi:YjbE family integral membrane protein